MSDWYYAHDGQQKGPVQGSELHRLAAEGDFDPQNDLVWKEGMADWQPASTIPELQPAPARPPAPEQPQASGQATPSPAPSAGDSLNPYSVPTSDWAADAPNNEPELAEIPPGSEPLQVGPCIARGFELTKRHFVQILAVALIMVATSIGVAMVLEFVDRAMGYVAPPLATPTGNAQIDEVLKEVSDQGSFLNRLITMVVDTFLGLGLLRIGLNIVSGKPFTIGLLYSQGRITLRALVAGFLYGIMVVLGLLLFIAPGIYLATRFGYYKIAIVDKNLGIFESFSYSSQITENSKMSIFVLALLMFLIVCAGALALVVGLLFAYPVAALAWVVSYKWLLHGPRAAEEASA